MKTTVTLGEPQDVVDRAAQLKNERLDALEGRMRVIEKRVDALDAELYEADKLDPTFDEVVSRVRELERKMAFIPMPKYLKEKETK